VRCKHRDKTTRSTGGLNFGGGIPNPQGSQTLVRGARTPGTFKEELSSPNSFPKKGLGLVVGAFQKLFSLRVSSVVRGQPIPVSRLISVNPARSGRWIQWITRGSKDLLHQNSSGR
jgi:hypothetical protein